MTREAALEDLYQGLTTLTRRARDVGDDLHPGLTLLAYTLLAQIDVTPGARAADLAARFCLDKSTLSRQLDQLIATSPPSPGWSTGSTRARTSPDRPGVADRPEPGSVKLHGYQELLSRAEAIAARPRRTGFSSVPTSLTDIRTTWPSSRVNGIGGTRQVPVDSTTPCGWTSANIR
jgi:hypothetical protein